MALKSETLQMPPILVGGCINKMIDDRTSGDEDLEDGEIFDDDDDEENKDKKPENEAKAEETTQQPNQHPNKKDSGKHNTNEGSGTRDGAINNSSVNVTSSNSGKSTQIYQSFSWRKTGPDLNDDGIEKKKKSKKRKRRRGDDEDIDGDVKHEKKKKISKSGDKDVTGGDPNSGDDTNQRMPDDEMPVDDEDDDDEMLFVRGASPQHFTHHSNNRHYQDGFQSDGDNEEMDFDEDDFLENDDDLDDCDDDERRLHSNLLRLDRAARRERLSQRGKRRGHLSVGPRKKRDDNEVCIFYMQGKCHKGSDCQFSHEAMPHKKQELCKFYLMDCCNKKDKCLYMHSEFPCKYYHMGLKCYANKSCRFSHSKLSESMRQVFIKTFGPIRSKGEFPSKKGSTNKHSRSQDTGGDFSRSRDGRRDGGDNPREKKIPSLFDIKVSIPDEMRKDYNSDSDGGGNRTPMPSPPITQGQPAQQTSDSSRSPPQMDSNTVPGSRRRRKERRNERSSRKSGGQRERGNDSDNDSANCRRLLMPGGPFSNDNWDDGDHQEMFNRLRMDFNNLNDDDDSCSNNNNANNSDNTNSGNKKGFFDSVDLNRIGLLQQHFKQQQYDSDGSEGNKFEASGNSFETTMHSDDSTPAGVQSTNTNDSNSEMFPAHLPKKQRELFLRIQQQQRQASETSGSRQQQVTNDVEFKDGSSDVGGENNDRANEEPRSSNLTFSDNLNDNKSTNLKLQSDDQNWYSSDEEDYQQMPSNVGTPSNTSISAILQNLVRLNSESSSSGNALNSSVSTEVAAADVQASGAYSSSQLSSSVTGMGNDSPAGRNNMNATNIPNVDFDVNKVSELLSKVKQHFQTANEKKVQEKRRDPRLRTDVGPSGDTLNSSSTSSLASLNANSLLGNAHNENHIAVAQQNEDSDLQSGTAGNRGVGAGDMDLRNLPFKPAPVHSAATEIDASINSHVPLPYKLIPIVVPKPDYSSVQLTSKVGAADPRLRKTVRLSEDSTTVVSSRDPRHRLIDDLNKNKTTAAVPHNSDPRQRSRVTAGPPEVINPIRTDDQLPPSLMLPPSLSHIRPAYPLMPGTDPIAMCPPVSRMNDDQSFPPSSPMINSPTMSRPGDPRQRHSQTNLQLPTTQAQAAALFDVLTAMNSRQPGFLTQTGDPRSRPSGMPNVVFPGAIIRPNDSSINKGQYGFK